VDPAEANTDELVAMHLEEMEALKSQSAAKEEKLLARIAEFEQKLDALNAGNAEQIEKLMQEYEEVTCPVILRQPAN
jgi:DNA-binding GntR family transcriptional regulator